MAVGSRIGIFEIVQQAAKERFCKNRTLLLRNPNKTLAVAPGGSKTSGKGFWPEHGIVLSNDAGQGLFGFRNKKSWVTIIYKFMT